MNEVDLVNHRFWMSRNFLFFFGDPAKGAWTQVRACTYTGRQIIQVGKESAQAGRKPTRVAFKNLLYL